MKKNSRSPGPRPQLATLLALATLLPLAFLAALLYERSPTLVYPVDLLTAGDVRRLVEVTADSGSS